MIKYPSDNCRKFTVKYMDSQKMVHDLELYAFNIGQAREDAIDLNPYLHNNPNSILGITEH